MHRVIERPEADEGRTALFASISGVALRCVSVLCKGKINGGAQLQSGLDACIFVALRISTEASLSCSILHLHRFQYSELHIKIIAVASRASSVGKMNQMSVVISIITRTDSLCSKIKLSSSWVPPAQTTG
jgi:hypothetical protein